MAFDGIVISNILYELRDILIDSRIGKVTQPEKDEIILTIRKNRKNYKLLLSSMASMPKLHLTNENKTNPITAPNFCMLLRKHLIGGQIKSITQPNFERIVIIELENMDELGETCSKKLIIEIMGRHSNIILTNESNLILDSIRRVGAQISSVREVFPNRVYVLPPDHGKVNPLNIDSYEAFYNIIKGDHPVQKSLYQQITGLSPEFSEDLCYRSNIHGDQIVDSLDRHDLEHLYTHFNHFMDLIKNGHYSPTLYCDDSGKHITFSSFKLEIYQNETEIPYDSISELIEEYYLKNAIQSRISQKSVDLRRLVQTNLERCYKKLNLQLQQIEDTKDRDKFKIKGELIQANIYKIKEGDSNVDVYDYYNNQEITISLDVRLNASKNAQKQFNKYNKKKRTLVALSEYIEKTKIEIKHLESVKYALENALKEEDLLEVRHELMETGYLRFRHSKAKKALKRAEPMHFISSDGFHIYVGKNNYQNDMLSTKFANGGDWWFHAKGAAGSHVIVKTNNTELPDRTYEEAAALAAYYSKNKNSPKVSVDYTLKKHIKKPNGSAPGYVIYHTNYSMMVTPSINGMKIIVD